MHLSVCICIPVYDNGATVSSVVRDCLRLTPYSILVIDDGSARPVVDLLDGEEERAAFESRRLTVIRFPTNRGKGAAIRRAFTECITRAFTHVVTMDGDGQHFVTEIPKLVAAAQEDPWALVIGNRNLERAPSVSRFGRGFSNFWVERQTDVTISDSQSGFRLYPLFPLQSLFFRTTRFDFEIEVLIRLLWKNVTVREIAVDVHYPKPEDRVSHFHKVWDNVRISLLNTVLVALSLIRARSSPTSTAVAVGLGAFIGCTPFFGFHAGIALLVAFTLRLNVVALLLGTQISIPPVAPILALASIKLGDALFGPDHLFRHWLYGSFVVGSAAALSVGGLTFFSARALKSRYRGNWTGKSRGGVFGNWFLKTVTLRLGLSAGRFCLLCIVPYFWIFAPRARRASLEYWGLMEPGLSWWKKRVKALRHFHRFAEILLDRMYEANSTGMHFHSRSHGFENIREKLRAGEGVILLTAHVGAWEIAASHAAQRDNGDTLHLFQYGGTVGEPAEDSIHFANLAAHPILKLHTLLNEGRAVALMGDRPMGKHYELVPFFGKLAPVDTTAFRIAAATGKHVVFTFGFKGEGETYDFHAVPAGAFAFSPSKSREECCREWASQFATVLETYLRRYPDQWFNFYPFWSSRPVAPTSVDKARPQRSSATRAPAPIPMEVG